jgi:photosystem II stability/assembly factor-like uncharacterized protein
MIDVLNGWAVGGAENQSNRILSTADGGLSWRDVTPPEPSPPGAPEGTAITFFLDADRAWVTFAYQVLPATPTVWRTQDGGFTWQASQPVDITGLGEFYSPSDLQFSDDQHGWMLIQLGIIISPDFVALFNTQDGGLTWQRAVDPAQHNLQQSCGASGVTFRDPQTGWVAGDCLGLGPGASFQRTRDGGQTWEAQPLPPPAEVPNLFEGGEFSCGVDAPRFASPQNAVLAVACIGLADDSSENFLYATADGGETWNVAGPLPVYDSFSFINPSVGWVLGASAPQGEAPRDLFHTTDGGLSWSKVTTVAWRGQLNFVDEQTGWAVAQAGGALVLIKTADGGQTWQTIVTQRVP